MPESSNASAPAVLLKPERSRWLPIWWSALHCLAGLALLRTHPGLALVGWPVVLLHARLRRPASTGLILIAGSRFSLPAEGRYGLEPARGARAGRLTAELVFSDRPGARIWLIRDQLDAAAWRVLRLALGRGS